MAAARTLKFEVAALFPLQHEKLVSIPLLLVFHCKYLGKGFLTGPLDLDPLKRRAVRRHRNILMPIYVRLNLFDVSLWRLRLNSLIIDWWLEPISHLENIPCFQILIVSVALVLHTDLILCFLVLPFEDLLV